MSERDHMLDRRWWRRFINWANALRHKRNEHRKAERAEERVAKKALKAQGLDVFKSNLRREVQAKRDEAELAKPVRSVFSAGSGILNLRPIEERVAARERHPSLNWNKRQRLVRVRRRARIRRRGY